MQWCTLENGLLIPQIIITREVALEAKDGKGDLTTFMQQSVDFVTIPECWSPVQACFSRSLLLQGLELGQVLACCRAGPLWQSAHKEQGKAARRLKPWQHPETALTQPVSFNGKQTHHSLCTMASWHSQPGWAAVRLSQGLLR